MNELAEYSLVAMYPVFIFARALSLHVWEVDLYPVSLAQVHLGAIIGIAGVMAYKTAKKAELTVKKNESRPKNG